MRRWLSKGSCKGRLTPQERILRKQYARILSLANSEAAIADGDFFDLMYVNLDNPTLNPHRHYAFLRHKDDELLVIAVNFGDTNSDIKLNIPHHAFECLGLPQGEGIGASELLSGLRGIKTLSPTEPFEISVAAHGAAVWKITAADLAPKPSKETKKNKHL